MKNKSRVVSGMKQKNNISLYISLMDVVAY
jgi:hypothetical protein